jgi:hypothetical protein
VSLLGKKRADFNNLDPAEFRRQAGEYMNSVMEQVERSLAGTHRGKEQPRSAKSGDFWFDGSHLWFHTGAQWRRVELH